jgi:hypothetical protein
MDYLFQDGGKPEKTKSKTASKTKSSSKTSTKTTKSKTSSKTGTKTTKSKTTSKKSSSKKGGNFLGTVGDLVAPTGWGPFATAAGLLALDRADAALRRGKSTKSSAKKGGMRGGDPHKVNPLKNSGNNNLSNKKGSLKIRGNKPNTRQQVLDRIMAEKNQELQFGHLSELPSFPKKNKKSNILTNSRVVNTMKKNQKLQFGHLSNSRVVNTMKKNQELQFGHLSELPSFPKKNKNSNILTNSRVVNTMKKNKELQFGDRGKL